MRCSLDDVPHSLCEICYEGGACYSSMRDQKTDRELLIEILEDFVIAKELKKVRKMSNLDRHRWLSVAQLDNPNTLDYWLNR